MNKYIITAAKITGRVLVWFRDGFLVKVSFEESEISNEQKAWFMEHIEVFEGRIRPSLALKDKETQKPVFTITQEVEKLTFDMFYDAYNYKEGRKKAENAWARLSEADRLKAYQYIQRYRTKKTISGTALEYPASYLNAKRWED